MDKITLPAFAKINLFLEITGKRPDGYHDIDTVMQTVSLHDDVTVSLSGGKGIEIVCPGVDVPDEKNLAWRAAKAYLDRYGISDGISIRIEKRIPEKAGLAGGSADAAAVLRAMNAIFGAADAASLAETALTLGSDVPFCVYGGCARAAGRGEILYPLSALPDCFIVVAKGADPSPTPEAYARADTDGFSPRANNLFPLLGASDIFAICRQMFNRFEYTAVYDASIKPVMMGHGALAALLSGSGSAVFGIFGSEENARSAHSELSERGMFSAVCRPEGAAL